MTPLLLLLLRRWTWFAGAGVLALAALGGGWLVQCLNRPALARATARAEAAEAQARAAAAQARLDGEAAAAVETARAAQTRAAARTGDAARAIVRLPRAQDALDPAVLAEWSAAVDGLRREAGAARSDPAPAGGGGPSRAVPPA